MNVRIFEGELTHQNPICAKCSNHCYTLYAGGRKDRVEDMYFCKRCKIIYKVPSKKKCKYTEVPTHE